MYRCAVISVCGVHGVFRVSRPPGLRQLTSQLGKYQWHITLVQVVTCQRVHCIFNALPGLWNLK